MDSKNPYSNQDPKPHKGMDKAQRLFRKEVDRSGDPSKREISDCFLTMKVKDKDIVYSLQ